MRFKNLDLTIILIIVVINIVWIQLPSRPWLPGIIFALPLTFFLPGYALTQVLFRKPTSEQPPGSSNRLIRQPSLVIGRPVTGVEKLLLGFGLSMAIDVLVGFGLNLLPIGLGGLSWVTSLGLITTAFALLTMLLRRQGLLNSATSPRPSSIRITLQDFVLLAMALLITVSAVWFSVIRPLVPEPSFTQLWMLQSNQNSKACIVSIGVQSFEVTAETYQVVVTVNKTPTYTSSIVLQPQQKWLQSVPVTPQSTSNLVIEAQLYRNDKPTTQYRSVHLTLHVSTVHIAGPMQYQCTLGE